MGRVPGELLVPPDHEGDAGDPEHLDPGGAGGVSALGHQVEHLCSVQ